MRKTRLRYIKFYKYWINNFTKIAMIRIPCVEEGEKVPVFATLLELLFGYAYDQRTTQVCPNLILPECGPCWCWDHRSFQPLFRIKIRIRILIRSIRCFWPPGSASGSFHQQAKKWRKTLISPVLWLLYDFLSLTNEINVPSIKD